MTTSLTPSELARGALRTLATRKRLPAPESDEHAYREIGGTAAAPEDAGVKPALAWPELSHDLLKKLDTPPKGSTIPRKQDGVETVLGRFSSNSEALYD